jgi:alpha-1,2-glucosyltransferase
LLSFAEENQRSTLWRIGYFACCGLVLIPAALLEFRYFVVPFFLLALNVRSSVRQAQIDTVLYLAINAITLYLFLYCPFTWPNGELCRFMW